MVIFYCAVVDEVFITDFFRRSHLEFVPNIMVYRYRCCYGTAFNVTDTSEVMPYESAEAISKSAKHISVADCMCRKISDVKGEPCDRPMEVCLQKIRHCKFRAKYDQNPRSFLGRIWKWHIGWCPGWKSYVKSKSEEEREELKKSTANRWNIKNLRPFS